jgi:hypothetical protein
MLLSVLVLGGVAQAQEIKATDEADKVVLVELFTSQG